MRAFKNQVENFDLVDGRASHRYLWTEKGALLHAKSLNTDKAWEAYEYLVDFYRACQEFLDKLKLYLTFETQKYIVYLWVSKVR